MTLSRRIKWVSVKNVSDRQQRLVDFGLSGGELIFEPGQETQIPAEVWMRNWRLTWLQPANAKPVETPESEPELETLKLKDLQKIATGLGIEFKPVGTPKADLIALIQSAKEGSSNEE